MRFFDVFIFGVQTKLGQEIYKIIREKYPFLSVAVPMMKYSKQIEIPCDQVNINQKNIKRFVKSMKVIISCQKMSNLIQEVSKICQDIGIKFANAYDISPLILLEIIEMFLKPYGAGNYNVIIPIKGFKMFSYFKYGYNYYFPNISKTGTYELLLTKKKTPKDKWIKLYLEFQNKFVVYCFIFFALLSKILLLFNPTKRITEDQIKKGKPDQTIRLSLSQNKSHILNDFLIIQFYMVFSPSYKGFNIESIQIA